MKVLKTSTGHVLDVPVIFSVTRTLGIEVLDYNVKTFTTMSDAAAYAQTAVDVLCDIGAEVVRATPGLGLYELVFVEKPEPRSLNRKFPTMRVFIKWEADIPDRE